MNAAAHALAARVVSSLAEAAQLRVAWDALLKQSPSSTPWQEFDFLWNWWPHMAGSRELRIVVVERGGRPCLIMPLQLTTLRSAAGLSFRVLEPVGMPQDVNRPRLSIGPHDPPAYRCALQELQQRRHEWQFIRIFEMAENDPELPQLREFAALHGLIFRERFSHLCPWLDLQQSWETYLSGRSSKLRKNLRAAQRRLEQHGAVTLRSYETREEMGAGFSLLLDLHRRSWKTAARVEYGASEAYRNFYEGWLDSMAGRGQARILALTCGDRPVAATLAFATDRTYYSAQIVHDAAFDACSPGTLLESLEIEQLMSAQRFRTYDFLGSYLNNKLRWTDTSIRALHVYVMQRSLRNLVFGAYAFGLKPVARRLTAGIRGLRKTR